MEQRVFHVEVGLFIIRKDFPGFFIVERVALCIFVFGGIHHFVIV